MLAKPLTPKQEAFVREYLVDLCGAHAAIRAGYAKKSAKQAANELLSTPKVQDAISAAQAARANRLDIKADEVLRHFWSIATADPRELMEFRRTCCRYCWGARNRYQRTAGEMERDKIAHAQLVASAKAAGDRPPGRFDPQGGNGYHAKREPSLECGECFGDGIGQTHVHDTKQLSPAAARLYAGVKQTKEGLEVKTHDQQAALVNVARHLGMFKDKVDAEVSGTINVNIRTF